MRGNHGEDKGDSTYLSSLIVPSFLAISKSETQTFFVSIMASYSTPPNEKAEVFEAEAAGRGQVDRIDAMATAPGTTLESFSHLDEKKILRKVCSGHQYLLVYH